LANHRSSQQSISGLLLILGLAFCHATHAAPADAQADAGLVFDDNVTRANDGGTRLVDRSCIVSLNRPVMFPLADHLRALLTGLLDTEFFDRYQGLNRLTGAVQGELQYRGSAEFGAPMLAIFTRIAAERYRSDMRDGFRYSVGASLQQAATDRIRLTGAVTHNERRGRSELFNNRDNAARIGLDYTLSAADTLYLDGEYRRGDLVISGPEFWTDYSSNTYTLDDAFPGMEIYSFRFDGATLLSTLGYNLKTGTRNSVDFSWKRARSTASYATSLSGKASLGYVTNQYSLAYLIRF